MGLQNCVNGIERAILKNDYEKATELISNILNIEDINKNQHINMLTSSEVHLKDKIKNEFQKHVNADNREEITRFYQFMLPLGIEKDGIVIYLSKVKESFDLELEELQDLPWIERFPSLLDLIAHYYESKSVKGMNWIYEWITLADPIICKELKEFETKTLRDLTISIQMKLEDLLHVSSIYFIFFSFITKIREDLNTLPSLKIFDGFSTYYKDFETHLFRENFKKAVSLNEIYQYDPEEGEVEVRCDSMIHDVFYLVKASLDRAVSSQHPSFLRENVSVVKDFIFKDLREEIFRSDDNFSVLNNLDAVMFYVSKHPRATEFSADLVHLKELVSSRATILFQDSVQREFTQWLDEFRKITFEIDENGFHLLERNDPLESWLSRLDSRLFNRLKVELSKNCLDILVSECLTYVLLKMESIMYQKRFTQYGGLFLDKQLRSMVFYFSDMSIRTVRDKFMRLNQIVSLLKLFKVSEALELWNDHTITWKLTFLEIRKVLELRVDFGRDAIHKLKF